MSYFSFRRRMAGFTLVELLVVIGIIGLLISILMPALGKARRASQAVVCQSNMRQMGLGVRMYAEAYKGALPAAGDDGDSGSPILMPDKLGWASDWLWMNAVSKYTFGKTYNQIYLDSLNGGKPVPGEGEHHVLICPSAPSASGTSVGDGDIVKDGYFMMSGYYNGAVEQRPTFVCYAMNYKLFGSTSNFVGKLSQLRPASEVCVIFEKRTSLSEVTAADDAYFVSQGGAAGALLTSPVGRFRGDWRRFSARHSGGGFVLFADGHVQRLSLREVETPSDPGKNWNKPGTIIWNITGPAK